MSLHHLVVDDSRPLPSKTVARIFYTGQPASEVIDHAKQLANSGSDHVIFNVADEGTPVERLGTEVLPALAEF